jgi:hypothetical protein
LRFVHEGEITSQEPATKIARDLETIKLRTFMKRNTSTTRQRNPVILIAMRCAPIRFVSGTERIVVRNPYI